MSNRQRCFVQQANEGMNSTAHAHNLPTSLREKKNKKKTSVGRFSFDSFPLEFPDVLIRGNKEMKEKLRPSSDPVAYTRRNVTSALRYRHNKTLKKKMDNKRLRTLGTTSPFSHHRGLTNNNQLSIQCQWEA
jgi:hypothetical protein